MSYSEKVRVQEEYRRKLVAPEEAVQVVKSGDWIEYGFGHTKPIALDKALAARKGELKDINIRVVLSLSQQACIEADPEGDVFTLQDWHFSGYSRKLHDRGRCFYHPMIFRNQPLFYRKSIKNVDVAMIRVTKMDKDGFFNFHMGSAAVRAALDVSKKIIVEVNPLLPWAMGGRGETVHIDEIDHVVEYESKVEVIPPAAASEIDKKIAEHIMPLIPNGACIQLGIGGLPNVLGTMLVESDVKDLGCHTEMLVDAYYHMYQAGKLTNKKKSIDKNKSVWSFAAGSQFLYDWIDKNPSLAAYEVSYTNAPHIMSQNDNLISINACIEVDLFGQVSSESSGPRHISGTGGQLDFATGAYMSEGGISFICCNASYKDKQGNIKSRIVPTLPVGSIVTVPRTQSHMIVTEYGIADLAGKSTWQKAEALINIAHPDLRDELVKEAEKMNIWRKNSN
ncbi:MAG: butyryl-CoA:acetate CoA-transferase [Syntrophales bacterium]|jgi:butyryl-CoA:acetate CoA-transferase|nr:butyryl-CoA:acetate CoA-transferase [Syntrophales bacterium]MCK9392204.1 butyryl-CoA:acetate CoA-transferase [Syntrophales bacterium]